MVALARLLGAESYGLIAALFGLAVAAGGWVGLGSGFAMLRAVASDRGQFNGQWVTTMRLVLATGTLLGAAYVASANLLLDVEISWMVLAAIAVTELLLYPLAYLCSFALQAHERIGDGSAAQTAMSIARLAGILMMAALSVATVEAYAVTALGSALVGYAVCRWLVQRRLRPTSAAASSSLRGVRTGVPFALSWSSTVALGELDKVLAFRLTGAESAGLYGVGYRIAVAICAPVSALAYALQPRLFRLWDTGEHAAAIVTIRTTCLMVMGYATIAALILFALAPVAPWLLGPGFEASADVVRAMAPFALLLCLRISASNVLTGLGSPGLRAALELGCLVLMAMVAWLLSQDYGIFGIVVALTLSEGVLVALITWRIIKCLKAEMPATG